MKEAQKEKVRHELIQAVTLIMEETGSEIVPDDGIELVSAIPGARSPDDVGSVLIPAEPFEPDALPGAIRFGSSSWLVSGLLTALRFSPEMRCACTIRYSEHLCEIAEEMLFEICTIDAEKIPPGVSTMDWAVAFCSEQESGVPEILIVKYESSGVYQARMFAENSGQNATNLIKISKRIIDATH